MPFIAAALSCILCALPCSFRFWLYNNLALVGNYFYPGYAKRRNERLPFNLFLKRGADSTVTNEACALDLVRRHTNVPVPYVLDNLYDPTEQVRWLLMTRIDGEISGPSIRSMSPAQRKAWGQQLAGFIHQLRAIPNPFPNAICSAAGGPLEDPRVESRGCPGPFDSEADLNATLRRDYLKGIVDRVDRVHSIKHDIYFTHADLSHRNILTRNGRIVGIVDWEFAGWYPEYWEYTKAHFLTFRDFKEWSEIWKELFPTYEEELALEMEFWSRRPSW